ncbi:MAG: TetR/AcrR family transcriptional regulator [Syntrophothermus sp.]
MLAAAAEVIAERGVAATRISDVAERCGVSPPAVLYWFDSKERLLAEALIADDARFYEELSARLATAGTPRDRLSILLATAAEDSPDFALWMELWTWSLRDESLRRARERFDSRWREEIAAIVVAGQRAGEFGDIDAARAALAIGALIDGLTVQVALGDPEVDRDGLLETAAEFAGRLLETELDVGKVGDPASA